MEGKNLTKKTLLISGGSSGIGEACVTKFLESRYFVFNLDIKDNFDFNQHMAYSWIETDVRSEASIINAINTLHSLKIDTLIVSAGKHLSATIEKTTTEQLMDVVGLNLFGAFWVIQHSLALISDGGSIVTIGSDQYQVAKPNSAAYGMTKAALAHLTKSTALDYAKRKIRANCIGAGTIDTPLYRTAIESYALRSGIDLNQIEAEEGAMQPIGRIGMACEVADLAFFLASDAAKFITGAYMPLDGGYTAR